MRLLAATPGMRGVDCDAVVTDVQAVALFADGNTLLGRCVHHRKRPDQDATRAEVVRLTARGHQVYFYGLYREEGWNAQTGAEDGKAIAAQAVQAGERGVLACVDMEGVSCTREDAKAYAAAARDALRAGGCQAGLYLARDTPLTAEDVAALAFDVVWSAAQKDVPEAPGGFGIRQLAGNVPMCGGQFDTDEIPQLAQRLPMLVAKDETTDARWAAWPSWLLDLADPLMGETAGQHIKRAVLAFVGCSLHSHPERLIALAAVDDPYDAAKWAALKTNCATTMRWLLSLVGCPSKFVTQPDVVGMSMSWDIEAARECGALISLKDNPDAWKLCDEGWGLHYGIPGTNDDHVEWCLSKPDANGIADHAGGGREDNAITQGRGDIRKSLGRPLLHVSNPNKMRIPVVGPPSGGVPVLKPGDVVVADPPPAYASGSAGVPVQRARVGAELGKLASFFSMVTAYASRHPVVIGLAVLVVVVTAVLLVKAHRAPPPATR